MLEALRHHADPRVRDAATSTLALDRALRARPAHPSAHAAERAAGVHRLVYDCAGTQHLPGTVRRREAQPPQHDADVDRAYDAAGTTYEFFERVFGRTSIDGRGMHLVGSVHYGLHYNNAFWNGAQMVYGDGDGIVFRSFTSCVEIIAHELAHGLTHTEVGFEYVGESGALGESLSDVFGSLVKQWSLGQSAHDADWIIGAGQYTDAVRGTGLRSLAAPGTAYDDPALGKDVQPRHMRDYADLENDRANVHINSGIPNHAFYLFAKHLGGNAWDTAGHVWYDALRSGLSRTCTFQLFADATVDAAQPHGGPVVTALARAWRAVGITTRRAAAFAKGATPSFVPSDRPRTA